MTLNEEVCDECCESACQDAFEQEMYEKENVIIQNFYIKYGKRMKQLNSIENNQVSLEVIECDCGFHLGIDSTWLEMSFNSIDFEMNCPACNKLIPVDKLTRP